MSDSKINNIKRVDPGTWDRVVDLLNKVEPFASKKRNGIDISIRYTLAQMLKWMDENSGKIDLKDLPRFLSNEQIQHIRHEYESDQ